MRDALVRYKMYLALKKSHPDKFLVPCYDIDLVWHTHQVHPALYYGDTMGLLGFVLKVSAASYGAVYTNNARKRGGVICPCLIKLLTTQILC